ncbi:MAG: PilZ domain-containing protein [Desulfobacula sp.]|jgi:UDP-GlcNAc:undecaprenyl-phosphate GlcNAc-1-phosphate transferase|nr:PilZ domain-containing protein [Desulfobacula sp.]
MISPEFQPALIFIIALFATMFALPKLAHIARKINLLDQPNWRKSHTVPKPLVGGIGFILSACFASSLFIPAQGLRGFFAGLAVLLFIGFLDDLKEMGHRQKFVAQIFATVLLITLSHTRLISFGDLLGTGELIVPTYWLSFIVTLFCVIGVINSMNLIDGLDGLAGGLGFVAFMCFAAHASFAGSHLFLLLNLAFAGALLGFLRFNWHPAVLFMGDAGSLCLGFVLAFMAIGMSQGENACIRPVTALLILAVPISDTLTIMTKRVMEKKSPFHPDRFHLHHILMRYGLNRKAAVKTIIGFGTILGSVSLLGPIYHFSDRTMFMVFGVYFFLYFLSSFFIIKLLKYSLKFQRKRDWCGTPCLMLKKVFEFIDRMNLIRKNDRFPVALPMQCFSIDTRNIFPGKILNISRGGCMASIPGITSLGSLLYIDVNLAPLNTLSSGPIKIMAEHIWISTVEGIQLHGFQFVNLDQEQENALASYTTGLKK